MLNPTLTAFAATANPDVSRPFYEETLGSLLDVKLAEATPFALVFAAAGVELRLQIVAAMQPPPYTVLGWSVNDLEAAMNELVGRGVVFEQYEMLEQDRQGVWTAPGDTQVAWFKRPGRTAAVPHPAGPVLR
ncbi:MAG: VOC family protein [Pseudomonadota bacterium]